MKKLKVYLVTVNSNIEFSNGNTTGWNEKPSILYGYNDITEAKKRIWELKQKEVIEYRKWLKEEISERNCFIHHCYDTETIMVF